MGIHTATQERLSLPIPRPLNRVCVCVCVGSGKVVTSSWNVYFNSAVGMTGHQGHVSGHGQTREDTHLTTHRPHTLLNTAAVTLGGVGAGLSL